MSYTKLQQVLDSNDALDEGIDFFLANPKEFINLIKKNHKLALVFANTFKPEHIESMVRSNYGYLNHDKFFTMLLTMNTREIALQGTVTEQEMLEFFLAKHLPYLDTTEGQCKYRPLFTAKSQPLKYVFFFSDPDYSHPILWGQQIKNITDGPYEVGADLEYKYRSLTSDKQIVDCLLTIVAIMMEKITTAKLLDGEFKDEAGTFDTAKTNSVFPTLMKWPSKVMSQIVVIFLQNTSPKIAERELSANEGIYLKQIIENLPVTKGAYDAAYAILLAVATRGKTDFGAYIRKFNFGILTLLETKQSDEYPNLASQFYELGNIAPSKETCQVNPLAHRFPSSSHKYSSSSHEVVKPSPSPSMPIPGTISNNNNNNNNIGNSSSFLDRGYKSFSLPSLQRKPSHPPPPVPSLSSSLPNTPITNSNSPPPPNYYFPEQRELKELQDTVRRQSGEINELKRDMQLLKDKANSQENSNSTQPAYV